MPNKFYIFSHILKLLVRWIFDDGSRAETRSFIITPYLIPAKNPATALAPELKAIVDNFSFKKETRLLT